MGFLVIYFSIWLSLDVCFSWAVNIDLSNSETWLLPLGAPCLAYFEKELEFKYEAGIADI